MALWKLVIVSGSTAQLAGLSLDTALTPANGGNGLQASSASGFLVGTGVNGYSILGSNGTGQVVRSTGAVAVIMSGSFSGSFSGDGSGLTGISSAPTFTVSGSSGGSSFEAATDTLAFTTASIHGFDLSSSFVGTRKTISLLTPQDLRTTASPTFANGTFTGDLTVLGNVVQLEITNLNVEDRFVYFNSGSTTGDGGIVVGSGSLGNGVAFGWDDSAARWGIQQTTLLTLSSSVLAPEAYIAAVFDVDGGLSLTNYSTRNGNIRIESGNIYIYA